MLPDDGNRYDTVHRSLFKQYAAENALSWYIYVNSLDHLAREAPNGSLYLVTGCDKTRSWMTAAAARPSESHAISVKFAIGPIMEGRIALQTSWSTPYIDADTRIYPDYPDPMPQQDNQCVFMRGFTITVREKQPHAESTGSCSAEGHRWILEKCCAFLQFTKSFFFIPR